MLRRIFLFVLLLSVSFFSFAQLQADVQTPKIVPPSPDAAALGKYGEIPVDKSTGVPQISIPLYEIKTPRFNLPISLSYHASGIKVEEVSSWVGAGWVLNAGGVITRSIIGVSDDCPYGYLNNTIKKASDIQWPGDYMYIRDVLNKWIDTDPDNFSYNFNNHAGSFVFGDDKKPVLTPYQPIKINFNGSAKNFNVTDEQGNTYYFNTKENVTSSISAYMSGISSWYLTQMVSADLTDTVKFFYSTDATTQVDYSYNFSQDISDNGGASAYSLQPMVKTASSRQFNAVRISSIVFSGGKVDFIAKSGRLDEGVMSLDSLVISNLSPATNQYTRIKSFKLLQDYFYSTLPVPNYNFVVDEPDKHRLKLTGVQENDANNTAIRSHSFEYNTTMLPQVHSFAQDKWGYFNGQVANLTLLESRNVLIYQPPLPDPVIATIGTNEGADRSLSPDNMQAGVLTKITYPTKGYSTFSYECNKQAGQELVTGSFSAAAIGLHVENAVTNYTPSGGMLSSGGNIFRVKLAKGDGTNVPLPSVKIIRVSDGAVMYSLTADPNAVIDKYVVVSQLINEPYQLIATAQGGTSPTSSNPPFALIITTCQMPSGSNLINVGGLRINAVKHYNIDGAIASTETYKYGNYGGTNELGGGDPLSLIPLFYHSQRGFGYPYITVVCCTGAGNTGGVGTRQVETYSNTSVYPMITTSVSPVAYSWVTVYQGDAAQNNGKSVYNYNIYKDSILVINTGNYNNIKPISVAWKNGEPVWEGHYRNDGTNQYSLVQEKTNVYDIIGRKGGIGTSIGYVPEPVGYSFLNPTVGSDGQIYTQISTGNQQAPLKWTPSSFYWYDYPVSTGSRVLKQTTTNTYGPDGISKVQDVTKYYYDNLDHVFPTRIETTTSTGDTRLKQINYPQDMVKAGNDPTGIYNAMVTANMINPSIEVIDSKNTIQLLKSKTNYATFNGNLIKPQSVQIQNRLNPSETRLQYLNYDIKGNLLTVTKDDGPKACYQWGYNGLYPVAMATNTASNDIFYESFEEGNGNSTSNDSKTGHYSHTGAYSKSLTTLDNGAYTLTYWQKSGSVWLQTITPVNVTAGNYTISLNAQVDDICFCPSNALMTTYRYEPLIGLSSQTDPNGKTSYYQYDAFNRLILIRDKDNNILKKICYNYAGQPENCTLPCTDTTANWQNTSSALRCQQGSCGNTGYQEQEQKDMNVCSPTYNHTQWVLAGYNPAACATQICATITSTNTTGFSGYVASYYNVNTGVTYTFNVSAAGGLQTLGSLPEGTYNLTLSRPVGAASSIFKSGCKFQVITGTSAIFYNVPVSVSGGCKSITIDPDQSI